MGKEVKKEIEERPKVKKFSKKKKGIIISICIFLFLIILGLVYLLVNRLPELPKPEITSGARGELGIDKNINETTIDKYLGRPDSVYRDMRMLEDPSKYENIGGNRFLNGYIKGFEVIPLPYIIPVTGLPEEVGDTYIGETLFHEENGKYIANYKESMDIIEEIFPKDKVIFLMCGGGGYAGMTKNFLVSLGYDENKIYNVGGYWYYKGTNNIEVPKNKDGSYNFKNVPYHKINFKKLTKSTNYKTPNYRVNEVKISADKIEIEEGSSFKLSAIVLPNEADNKEVKWVSSDEKIATVDSEGLVKGVSVGETVIKVITVDKNREASCKVTIKKKPAPAKIKLDNIATEANEFEKYNIKKLNSDFYAKTDNYDSMYYTKDEDGGYKANELWHEEYEKYEKNKEEAQNKRIEILNNLVDNKKTFIILIYTKECDVREYEVKDGAAKILSQNGYSYLEVGTPTSTGEETLEKSHLDISNFNWSSSIAIIKNGTLYADIDPEADSIKSDEETKNWLSKYIDLK